MANGGDPPEDPSAETIALMFRMMAKRGAMGPGGFLVPPPRGLKRPFFEAFRSGDVVFIDPENDSTGPENFPPPAQDPPASPWDLIRDMTAAPEEAPTAAPTAEAPTEEAPTEEAPGHQPPTVQLDDQTDQYTDKHRQLMEAFDGASPY